MRRFFFLSLLLFSLLPAHQAVRADGVVHLAFFETFNANKGTGGNDGSFSGSIASGDIHYDIDGWIGNKSNSYVYGADSCLRFGKSDAVGTCTTPEIILIGTGKTATLTFKAAGWAASGTNTLTITANDGVELTGNTSITLTNGAWSNYSVNVTLTTAESLQLTFSGQRGFLDDVKVEETVTAIKAPTLTDEFHFWPNTTEENASRTVTLIPSDSTEVYYTTDGTTPSKTNGSVALLTTPVSISGTTTVRAVAYYGDVASSEVGMTYTQGITVDGLQELQDIDIDSEVRVFLNDNNEHEARVLYYDESRHQLFLRDKTKALCIDFGETATFNPVPQYNQHVAGWIVGRKAVENGMLKLMATENTSTDYLAFAESVTEGQTMPNDVNIDVLNDYAADWVTINEQRVGTDLDVTDRFGTSTYNGALADLTGIAIPGDDGKMRIALLGRDFAPAVVYVIDEKKAFVSPDTDIENATVRLKRTLGSGYWNTFAVPFDITSIDGTIREYDYAEGDMMMFKDASSIEAGKPYLVKPQNDIQNPDFVGVTLKATAANAIENGGYSFVAVYSPTDLKTDRTEQFLKTDGNLYYPTASGTTLRGMRAFFRTPSGQGARLLLNDEDGVATSIQSVDMSVAASDKIYDLQGRQVSGSSASSVLPKGIYIVRGKKIVIK